MRKYGAWIGLCLLLACIIGQSVAFAIGKEEKTDKSSVYKTIVKGYEAQYKIRGKKMSTEQMYQELTPYFTDNFLQVFTDENSSDTKTSGTYLLHQKAPFSFTNNTKMVFDKKYDLLYVYEQMKNESKMYEIIMLQKVKGTWKIAGYSSHETLLDEIKALEKER